MLELWPRQTDIEVVRKPPSYDQIGVMTKRRFADQAHHRTNSPTLRATNTATLEEAHKQLHGTGNNMSMNDANRRSVTNM